MSSAAHDLSPLVQTIEIAASPERVFQLFVDPDELVRWWPDAARLEPRVGGRIELEFEGRGGVTGRITRFDPPSALGFTWIRSVAPDVTTHVEVTIGDNGAGGSRVELVHSGWEAVPGGIVDEWRALHGAGWVFFLGCLRDLGEGRPVDKHWGG